MSAKIRHSWPLLLLLQKVKPGLRKVLLEDLADNKEICLALREIFTNYLKGNIKLNKADGARLRRHANLCKRMAAKTGKLKRKKLFKQVGGLPILPLLINAIIPLISSLLVK